MPQLVAIDLPGGAGFVDALRRAWDDGDAAFPLDRRLPPPAQREVLQALAPGSLIDGDGRRRLDGGVDVDAGDALVVATSGSTGAPKGVILTHDAVRASAEATSTRLGIGDDDVWLACLPLSHVGGLSVITRALVTGRRLVVHDGFDAGAVQDAALHGASAVSLVATALARIEPSLFRVIVLGGSRPPQDLPANVVTTYGLTETGSGVVYDGRPLDGVEIRLDDAGEIHLRGPMLMRGYRTPAADGAGAFDRDGWFATGDLGEWRPDGRLHVAGRRGDLIITGGENVWPERVEAALRDHPQVGDVAVAGVTDPEWGQRVVAWIVPTTATPPTLDELRRHVGESLPSFMAPRELRLVEQIPRTSLGKTARGQLLVDR